MDPKNSSFSSTSTVTSNSSNSHQHHHHHPFMVMNEISMNSNHSSSHLSSKGALVTTTVLEETALLFNSGGSDEFSPPLSDKSSAEDEDDTAATSIEKNTSNNVTMTDDAEHDDANVSSVISISNNKDANDSNVEIDDNKSSHHSEVVRESNWEENAAETSAGDVKREQFRKRTQSVSSIGKEVRNLRKQIEAEMEVDLDNINPEDLLEEHQTQRDSLDDHLYIIAVYPELYRPTEIYSCQDVPTLCQVPSTYHRSEPIIDDKLTTTYEANLYPALKNIDTFYRMNCLTLHEIPSQMRSYEPMMHLIPSSLTVNELVRKDVESSYNKYEISYLKDIKSTFSHSQCLYQPVPSEFVKTECTYQSNYKKVYENNESIFQVVPKQFKHNPTQLKCLPLTYRRFDGFQSDQNRKETFLSNEPSLRGPNIKFQNNSLKIATQQPASFKKNEPGMSRKECVKSFKDNKCELVVPKTEFVCENQSTMSAEPTKTLFNHYIPTFDPHPPEQPGGDVDVKIALAEPPPMSFDVNSLRRFSVPSELIDVGIEVEQIEIEYQFNEPILEENLE